ncbi:hypothetical protein [Ramlibacter humi]|uniref:Uncharacterized protein n=1 Tax=Ramlibacter humi TaxID=2530451 RepID=A0A4Z0BHD5_9BURK|nr:hypothetical protein [Ramlibacter humi]TFY98200.1 hypothetical protein EZ216_16495 [Ramlibacter humi]
MDLQPPDAVQRLENPEPLFPGEQWIDLAGGIAAWLLTRKHPSLAVRTLGTFLGATLVARAAHGRQRLSSIMRWTPIGGGIQRDRSDVV